MTLKNSKFLLILLVSFFSFPVPGQDNYVSRNEDRQNYNGTQSNNNSYGNRGTKTRRNENNSGVGTSAEGTGEYFLVPAIVRNDPQGTAIRMNTCGAAILHLLDKNALGGLTDSETLPLSKNTVLEIAESRFRTAIKFQPNNYLYHINLASALYRQGKIDQALASISRAIELNPNDEVSKNYEEAILRVKVEVRVLDDETTGNK